MCLVWDWCGLAISVSWKGNSYSQKIKGKINCIWLYWWKHLGFPVKVYLEFITTREKAFLGFWIASGFEIASRKTSTLCFSDAYDGGNCAHFDFHPSRPPSGSWQGHAGHQGPALRPIQTALQQHAVHLCRRGGKRRRRVASPPRFLNAPHTLWTPLVSLFFVSPSPLFWI